MHRPRSFPRVGWLIIIGLTAQAGARAKAEPSPCDQDAACREQLDQALQADRARRYEEALVGFRAAYKRKPGPRLAVNIGRTLHKMERYREAMGWYREAERTGAADEMLKQELRGFETDTRLAMEAPKVPAVLLRPTIQVQPAEVHLTPINNINIRLDTMQSMLVGKRHEAETRPAYKSPWLWATLGAVLAAGVIGGAVAAWPRPWQSDGSIPTYPIFSAAAGEAK